MARSNTSPTFSCDCALTFNDTGSVGHHVKQTGHMRTRWCKQCSKLFDTETSFQQHKRDSPKHRSNPTTPSASKAPAAKPRTDNPALAPNNPTVRSAPKPSGGAKGKKVVAKGPSGVNSNSTQAPQTHPPPTPIPGGPAVSLWPDPIATKYPWATMLPSPSLLYALSAHCHVESCLVSQNYYMGYTPDGKKINFATRNFVRTPAREGRAAKRAAVVIDCEMVGLKGGQSELARICVVDLFTSEILMNSLVYPTKPVKDWRTKYSGVTAGMMADAKASGRGLNGWPAARARLFQLVDADTILIGHALNHDLAVLQIIHTRIVDSAILVAEAVFGRGNRIGRQWALKTLSQDLLNVKIQSSKGGHDCLEDTLASRELVLWCLTERNKLNAWAQKSLAQFQLEKRRREERQREKEREKRIKKEKGEQRRRPISYDSDGGGDVEVMSWQEYLEACEYPPWYDPND